MEERLIPPDLLQIVRLTLRASQDEFNSWANDTTNPRPPVLRELVEQMRFSHKLILTYYGALGLLVLAFAVHHGWTRRRRQKRDRTEPKEPGADTPASNASSDTTLLASGSNSVKDLDTEQTPLLHRQLIERHQDGYSHVMGRHIRSFLIQQPRPLPALTAPFNQLPANGTSLVVLLLLAINLFYLLYYVPISVPMLFVFADRVGLLFVVNLPVLYLLGAKTNQPLQYLTGWSYERLNLFHRRLGEWMVAFGFLHGVSMLGVWYTLLRPFHFTLLRYLTAKIVLLGVFALIAYIAIWITSVGWVRYLYYEAFLGLHIVLQVAALALLFFHHSTSRPYVIAALIIWAADRIASRMFLSKSKLIATLQIAEDRKTVLVFCDIPLRPSNVHVKTKISHGWLPGQHVFISIPDLGVWHSLQSHPFTIASPAPPADMREGQWPLQLTIRAQDGFSKALLDFSRHHQHTQVLIDGPYGSDDALQAVRSADRCCFIAGGSGIAVTYPLSWDLHVENQSKSMVSARIVYDGGVKRSPRDLEYEQLDHEDHAHMWIRQDASADSWIGYCPTKSSVRGTSTSTSTSADGAQLERSVVDLIASRVETAGIHSRRPDIQTELRIWATRKPRSQQKLVVVVSGPDSLVRDVRDAASLLVLEGYNVEIHVEKFGW